MNILLIDDSEVIQRNWHVLLANKGLTLVSVFTPEQAIENFNSGTWDIIVLDGCIGRNGFNCLPVLEHIRQTYQGPIIAASTDEMFREIMVDKGCDYQVEKGRVHEMILEVCNKLEKLSAH